MYGVGFVCLKKKEIRFIDYIVLWFDSSELCGYINVNKARSISVIVFIYFYTGPYSVYRIIYNLVVVV
jgi:hypothetical protein